MTYLCVHTGETELDERDHVRREIYEGSMMKVMMHRSRLGLFEFFVDDSGRALGFYFTYQDEMRRVSDKNAMGSDENAF